MTATARTITERLRAMRKAAGLTNRQLADLIGTSHALISRAENEYDWIPSPETVRSWAAATGHPEDTPALLALLAEDKAAAARQAVTQPRGRDWCSQHRRKRSECRPEQTHVYPMRQRGDLMAEVERQAGGDINAFVTRALIAATGWEPPDGHSPPPASRRTAADRTAPSGVKSAAREKNGSTPGAASRPPVAAVQEKAAAVVQIARGAGHDVQMASELTAVPVGAAMFQAPGGEKVIRGLAPEVPDHGGKKGRPAPAPVAAACPPHPRKRVIKGFCYACGRQVPDGERIK